MNLCRRKEETRGRTDRERTSEDFVKNAQISSIEDFAKIETGPVCTFVLPLCSNLFKVN